MAPGNPGAIVGQTNAYVLSDVMAPCSPSPKGSRHRLHCGANGHETNDMRVVRLAHLVRSAPALRRISDLGLDEEAWRAHIGPVPIMESSRVDEAGRLDHVGHVVHLVAGHSRRGDPAQDDAVAVHIEDPDAGPLA